MTSLLVVLGVTVAVSAAARSTWSPCGLSMLSSLTPLAERGRGHRYRATALAGSSSAGSSAGARSAARPPSWPSESVKALGPSDERRTLASWRRWRLLIASASDLEFFGFRMPIHHRQVNERWLDQFRAWVYGTGFGLQIGSGLATYIMTAALVPPRRAGCPLPECGGGRDPGCHLRPSSAGLAVLAGADNHEPETPCAPFTAVSVPSGRGCA
jgi:hypothetical protein